MSFDLQAIVEDGPYWQKLVEKHGKLIAGAGWQGTREPAGPENEHNWDALVNFFSMHLSRIATEEVFEECGGGGNDKKSHFMKIAVLE